MKKDLKKRKKRSGSLKRSLLAGFLSIATAVVMLPELALPVYANSEAQESTGDALGERTFVSVTATGVSTVYDDQLHSGTVVVKTGELSKAYTVYYSTNQPLTAENYTTDGDPEVPAFKDADGFSEGSVLYLDRDNKLRI